MVFEPYTRPGRLQRLDADFGAVCGPSVDFAFAWFRKQIGLASILAVGAWILLIPAYRATAQTTAGTPPAQASTEKPAVHHAVHHHHHAKPEAVVAPAPVPPPPPLPPAEQPPSPATINFTNGLLSVRAQNSSLVNILTEIQHQTGLVIDGLNHDQRMYGQYGPASISTTLTALLDGSGYDFVIVGGGSSPGAARLILSSPGSVGVPATAAPVVANNPDAPPSDENPNGDQAEPADPTIPPQAKTPQEIFNEMRRQHPQ
jgi:hypothetical protein